MVVGRTHARTRARPLQLRPSRKDGVASPPESSILIGPEQREPKGGPVCCVARGSQKARRTNVLGPSQRAPCGSQSS
jgi:hypothetical protein